MLDRYPDTIPRSKMMFPKYLFPAVLLSAALISTTAATAKAQKVEVPFTGNIEPACEFTIAEGGTLAGNDSVLPTQLSSRNEKGQPGVVVVKCNTGAKISANSYQPTGGQKFEVSEANYTVSNSNGEEGEAVKVDVGENKIIVNLTLSSKEVIPVGKYSYNVLVTATH
jgi:predicted GNAT family acetyltransferase